VNDSSPLMIFHFSNHDPADKESIKKSLVKPTLNLEGKGIPSGNFLRV
jgi:hypothetical protein